MPYQIYHILHLIGLFLMVLPLGAIASHTLSGGNKSTMPQRKFYMALHGTGLLFVFVAGFGLMARAGYSFSNGWIYIKILCWLVVGMYPVIFYKQKKGSKLPIVGLLATLLLAILFVEYKFF